MKVLLTGGTGFLATHCLRALLQHGHNVVVTVRSPDKGEKLLSSHPGISTARLSYVIVEDIAKANAFDQAVISTPPFKAVVHTASPFHYNATDAEREMLIPAVEGTSNLLRAIHSHASSVERVVITSSFAAIMNLKSPPMVYNEDSWNPITWEAAKQPGVMAYTGSKKFAEKVAWEFVEKEKPAFTLSTINPPLIFGPIASHLDSLDNINTSNVRFRDMIQGRMKDGIEDAASFWVDVRDVALMHVAALETPEAAGKRFLAASGRYSNAAIAQIIKDNFPGLGNKFPEEIKSVAKPPAAEIDNSRARQILGVSFRTLEESVIDTVKSLLAVGK